MKNIKIWSLLTILLLSLTSISSQTKSEEPKLPSWKVLTQKEMAIALKSYAYATKRTSMKKNISYDITREIFYSPCPSIFPKIPGDFPCNLLELDLKNLPTQDPSMEYKEGGLVTIFVSDKPTPLMGGTTIVLSSELSTNDMQIFYNKDNTISHYRLGEKVVLFSWKKENGNPTLKKMMQLEVDKNLWAVNAKEIDFSK